MNQSLRTRQQFVGHLALLAAKLYRHERSSTLSVLLKELRNAVQARREGAICEEAEGFAWARAEWRVREGLVDPLQRDQALRLLKTIVRLGMEVFRRIGWHPGENAELARQVRSWTGVEVCL